MDSNRLSEIIANPSSCTKEEISALRLLARKYPYSSILKILNAKISAINQDESKDILLSQAAISSSDRTRLKEFMTTPNFFKNYNVIPAETTEKVSIIPEIAGTEKQETSPATHQEEPYAKAPDVPAEVPAGKPMESREEEVAVAGIAEELMINLAAYKEARSHFESLTLKTRLAEDTNKPDSPVGSAEENVEEKFKEILKPLRKKKASKKLAKEEQDLLINKFIEADSDASKPAKNENSKKQIKEDLSLYSSELSDDMVTETLANILITQGKLEKAIDIYRKLIWKLPQKKAYFAAQIELLKERILKQ